MTVQARPAADLRRARLSASATFAFAGLLFATWVPHIPEVKAHLGLSDAALGFALLGPALGSLLSMVIVGRLTARHGSGLLTGCLAVAGFIFSIGPGLATNLGTLFLALVLWGAGVGGLDVAMNAQAVQIEAGYGRPIMSSFHAYWSVGTVVGTVAGGIGAGLGIRLAPQQAVLAAVLTVLMLVLVRDLLPDRPAAVEGESAAGRTVDFRLVLLGVAGFCALLAEGASADWSPVYLRDDLGVSSGHTGFAYTAFTAMMVGGRTVGDRIAHRLGRPAALQVMGLLGAIGMAAGLVGNSLVSACVGFGCLGLGLSIMVPIFFGAAGEGSGSAAPRLAVVTTVSYAGVLFGPAALGPLADATSVHSALWVLPAFTLLATALGTVAFRLPLTGRPAATLSRR